VIGKTRYGQLLYKNPPNKPILFALTPDVQLSPSSLHLQVEATPSNTSVSFLHSHIDAKRVAICSEKGFREEIEVKPAVKKAQVLLLTLPLISQTYAHSYVCDHTGDS
jgi:hypothetical protein